MIPYAKQSLSKQDIDAVVQVLQSEFITQGPVVPQFEQALSTYCSVPYAIAVSHGTAALHLACLALEVGPGDRVWTSPNSFVASSNCALYCGAQIDFVDIDPKTYNISIDALEQKLQQAAQTSTLPKVVIPVDFAGQACDMRAIKRLSERYGFSIIEDAAHALGGDYLGQKIGSCVYSDITIFSFHPAKLITTGEGGVLTTQDESLAERINLLRSHGITRDAQQFTETSHGDWYYQQIDLGFNFRMTDIQAALGLSQIKKLDEFVDKRRELAQYYQTALIDLPIELPWQHQEGVSAWHLFVIQLLPEHNRKTIFEQMRTAQIGVHVHYIPIHTQPYYQHLGFKTGDFPNCENYYQRALTLPLFVDLTTEQIDHIVQQLTQSLEA